MFFGLIKRGGRSASASKAKKTRPKDSYFDVHVTSAGRVYVNPKEYLTTPRAQRIMRTILRVAEEAEAKAEAGARAAARAEAAAKAKAEARAAAKGKT